MHLFIYRYRHVRVVSKNYAWYLKIESGRKNSFFLSSFLFAAIFLSRNVFVSFRACKHCANALLGNVPIVAGDCSVIPYPWHAFHTKLPWNFYLIVFASWICIFFFSIKIVSVIRMSLLLNKLESLYFFFFQTSESNTCLILFTFKIIFNDNRLIWLLFARNRKKIYFEQWNKECDNFFFIIFHSFLMHHIAS